MSTLPATAAQPDHRLLYFGGAAFLIASALLSLEIWTESVYGYPAFVAGLFCIAFLGIVFPAVGRAVQGFLALWMWAALWMMATTAPIALFHALSRWMLDQLPLTFRWEEAVAMAGAVVLTVAIVSDGRSNRREGAFLLLAYAGVVAGFALAGNR